MAKIVVDNYQYSVDINASSQNSIPISMGLMKGDILVYRGEGDIVRLPVGQDGQVLTADSTAELGVKWTTLSE